ncbi:biopolymer transporter ExbD [Thalassotalea insulae]|uniref:Biopolymer transporter ExbD n=1 Tax=Thalassotalea insulae TaxID=2056778 RepID=A0ABQ6H094_9GAMM|nr:biopolymer transporter ExbD [Thalassotalea insulae]GLX79881.1 biopolymer transporter ExbD [Thalassotalea insulae]
MRRRKQPHIVEKDAGVDMTPMLDIVFILLIFFIVTTSFVKESGFLVKKSESSKASKAKSDNIMIHIDENNIIYFNTKPVDIERLPARVEYFLANHPAKNIIFRPHENTNYQKVVEVLDELKQFDKLKITMGLYKP